VDAGGWALGSTIYVIGAGLIVLGENLVKKSANGCSDFAVDTDEPLRRNRRMKTWLAGIFFFICGNGAHFVAFMFAPQSMLEALGASVLVWNLFISNQINRERVQSGHLGATVVILLGTGVALHYPLITPPNTPCTRS